MLFINGTLQNELEENGFAVIPFLNQEELIRLNVIYADVHHGAHPSEFFDKIHMTTWCKDSVYKTEIASKLENLFEQATNRFFKANRRLNNVFIVKKSGLDTTFKVHQDWNVVDEEKYQSVNVWIPLHDVDETSGALWVLKGSHRIKRKIRGAGYLFPDYSNFSVDLEKAAISVKLKAGEAIVFYHAMIHGSPPNLANTHRVAACFTVIPEQAPLCIYFQPAANLPLEQHEPDDDFVFRYNQLRTDSLIRPPSPIPKRVHQSFVNKKVEYKELKEFLKPKRAFFNFWKTNT